MKYIKFFEEKEKENPKIGDYVLVKEKNYRYKKLYDFTSNHIGKITNEYKNNVDDIVDDVDDAVRFDYKVKYYNIPSSLIRCFNEKSERSMDRSEIIEWSENKEDLEMIINIKKYNM